MNDVVILSESYAVVRYAGPYVAARSARAAGYKVKILDHGLLDVPLIDNAIGLASAFFKLPKYVPKANMADMDDDNKSSPKKSDAAVDEEDLRVYD